ncbi:MAG: hypothetical protein SFV22_08730 [Saprospiraceae bacterium]|nr:hypothetical protein [Saprospiraceae bacterium]
MKKRLAFLGFGGVLVIIWSMCFMTQGVSDAFTAGLGLSFTFLSIYFLQEKTGFNPGRTDRALLLFFPMLYALGTYIVLYNNGYFDWKKRGVYELVFYLHLKNPLNLALLMAVLSTGSLKDLKRPVHIFIFTYATLFYSYIFYDQWKYTWMGKELRNFNAVTSREASEPNAKDIMPDTTVNLLNFSFIGPDLDTSVLETAPDKFILLETWSESCLPCIKAMHELPDFYRSLQDKMEVFYVYEHPGEVTERQFVPIFQFKSIQDKSKIRIDVQQQLQHALGIKGLPFFLLFNSKGKLVFYQRGYPGKEEMMQKISEKIETSPREN